MYFKSKNILVTGGAGFIGINLIEKLVTLGANVTATLYKKTPFRKNNDVKYIYCDLRKPEDCRIVCKNIDYIFMCAANTSGSKVIAETPLVHFTPNILMNVNMLDAAFNAS